MDDKFLTLLYSLPSELYDMIFDLVLTPDCSPILIRKGQKAPIQLSLSRSCRKTFCKRYYSSHRGFHFLWSDRHLVVPWLASLEVVQRRKIRLVDIDGYPKSTHTKVLLDHLALSEIDTARALRGVPFLDGLVKMGYWTRVEAKTGRQMVRRDADA